MTRHTLGAFLIIAGALSTDANAEKAALDLAGARACSQACLDDYNSHVWVCALSPFSYSRCVAIEEASYNICITNCNIKYLYPNTLQ